MPSPTIISTFDTDAQGWSMVGDVQSDGQQPTGGDPGGYFAWVDAASGANSYFSASSAYLGDKSAYFGGTLSYNVLDSGDGVQAYDVQLQGDGVTLQYTNPNDASFTPGVWNSVSLTLTPGNFIDTATGQPPSEAVMKDVLANLSSLEIRAEFVNGPETGGLDNVGLAALPCYTADVRVRAEAGEVRIADLAEGDRVMTLSGALAPIRWIGRQRVFPAAHRDPASVLPIRIRAGALADAVPVRDLVVSPGHCLLLDGLLVEARRLVNDVSVTREPEAGPVDYHHLELDAHDIILAEGAAAETYLDTGNRSALAGLDHADRPLRLALSEPAKCARQIGPGAELDLIRARLRDRFDRFLPLADRDPDLRLTVDGRDLRPTAIDRGVYVFEVPAIEDVVVIASRSAVPAASIAGSDDQRRLGVALTRVVLRSRGLMIEIGHDHPGFAQGFHAAEPRFRWTDGRGHLPSMPPLEGVVTIEVHVAEVLAYGTQAPAAAGAEARAAA